MTAKVTLFVVCCSAFGQMDTSTLRAKYGEPIARETFKVRPNIEAVVNYGTGRQVCNIEMSQAQSATKQEVDQVVDELAPPLPMAKRPTGELRRQAGLMTISEPQDPDHPGHRTSVTITFNRPDCR